MKRLKFKTRIIIGFSIVIVLSMLIGIIGLTQIKKINKNAKLIYQHPLKVSNSVRDINVNINAIHRIMKDITLSPNIEQININVNQINYHNKVIYDAFKVVNDKFLGDISIVENTKNLFIESETIRNEIIELKKVGRNEEALIILKEKGSSHKKLLFEQTKKLTDFAQLKADEFYQSTNQTAQNSLVLISSITFLLIIISLITAVVISRSILKPIQNFIVEVKKIFEGNKFSKINFNSISEQKVFENTTKEIASAYLLLENHKNQLEKFNKKLDEKVEIGTKELAKTEELNRSITESAIDGIISMNSDGNILSWNNASEKIFGYSSSEMLHKNLNKVIPERYKLGHIKGVEKLKNGGIEKLIGKTIEINAIRKNGEEFPVELSLSGWKSDNEKYYTGIVRDITDRKKVKEDLIESKNRFQTLIEQAGDAMFLSDFEGNIQEVNKVSCNSLGYSREELLSMKISDLDTSFQKLTDQKVIWDKLKSGLPITIESVHRRKNGSTFPVEIKIGLFNIDNKISILGFSRDVTIRKEAEVELVKAKEEAEENNRLKTKFLNNLSHEIRTPMNGILGFSQFLDDPTLSAEKRAYFINIIQNSGNQLLQIIDDIIEISRLETKQVKVTESKNCLNDLLFELFSIFDLKAKENKTPLYFNKVNSDIESSIYTDATKLNKILSNLLENALKFTSEGHVELGYQIKRNDKFSELEIFVKDTGVGINDEDQNLIFERFSQADKQLSQNTGGLGLGLSIAKENTELLGGKISVESKVGEGTTFFITLPYKPVYTNEDVKSSSPRETKTIVIAEDEEVNYLYLETLIKDILKLDYTLIHAKNGIEVIEICEQNKVIDFVLMDLKMPLLNGYKATAHIKKVKPHIPIIAQTAYSTSEERKKAKLAGCNDFISKPIHKDKLCGLIEKYITKE